MKINQISFFNIGVSKKKNQDFYDVLKPGVLILNSDEKYLIIEFIDENYSNKIKILDYYSEWWELAANHLIKTNRYSINKKFLSGLIQCADQEDQDGLYEFANKKKGYVKFKRNLISLNKVILIYTFNNLIPNN